MTVIQASSAGVRDMADGSLRITLEFDPRHAKDAYALFGTRGTPVAVAAINQYAAQEHAQKETIEADKPKGGPLAKLAGMWCNDEMFLEWAGVENDEQAALFIRGTCGINSRAELDTNAEAARIFNEKIRIPYMNGYRKVRNEK